MGETTTMSLATNITKTVDVVDINLLKEATVIGTTKEDSSLDATVPSSCDVSEDSPSCSDGDCSVQESLGPPPLPSPTEGKARRVSFSNVEVREFPRCLGDNPSVSEGPPLALGPKPSLYYKKDVDEFEKQRDAEVEALYAELAETRGYAPDTPRRRRKPFEFNLPCRERIMILHWECSSKNEFAQAAGTSCNGAEIKRRIRDTQKTRRQREMSKALIGYEDLQIKVEGCHRKVKKMLRGKRKSKEQSELEQWATASSRQFQMSDSSGAMESQVKGCLKVKAAGNDVDV